MTTRFTRRLCCMCSLGLLSRSVSRGTALGDAEWMRHFREFIRAFNAFVDALDDNRLDHSAWQRMRIIWKTLDIG
jgi:hypothetical protein